MKFVKQKAVLITITVLAFSLCMLPMASLISLVYAAPLTWHPGEVELKDGIEDELSVTNAWVIKDGGTYKMWYTHSRADMDITAMANNLTSILSGDILSDLIGLDLEGLLADLGAIAGDPIKMDALWNSLMDTTTIIGYATSSDGINWDVQNDNVLEGNSLKWESFGMPCVINDGGIFKMWFTHTETSLDKAGLTAILDDLDDTDMAVVRDALIALANGTSTAIGYTSSADEVLWATPDYSVLGSGSSLWDSVSEPCVINDGGTFKMWFTKTETSLTIGEIDTILANRATFDADDLLNILGNTASFIVNMTSSNGITWVTPTTVMSGSSGIWDSVSTPCVIINSSTDYEMWYTNVTTDLTPTTFRDFIDEIQLLQGDIDTLWASLDAGNLGTFLTDLEIFLGDPLAVPSVPGTFDVAKAIIENTGTQIGYATSTDGLIWVEQTAAAISGNGGLWGSVTAPCVIIDSGIYKTWYTKGLEELTAQNIISVLDGSNLPIGYVVTGWNFIGLPSEPASPNIEDVLGDILVNVRFVWAYNAATGLWDYFTTVPGPPQGNLTQMTTGVGYWIELGKPAALTVDGAEPAYPYNIDLEIGWNLISIPRTPDSPNIEDVLGDILVNVRFVWTYTAATGLWDYFTTVPGPPQGNLAQMAEGRAYWVEMTAADTLTVN